MSEQVAPLISIIVPIYKVEQYLDECVNSILSQTYTNLEIILVDDGSPDNCPQKCDSWALKDKRIKVIHKPNGGLSDARNFGLNEAKGEFIAFVDSDDYISVDMIENLLNGFSDGRDIAIVTGMIKAFSDDFESSYNTLWEINQNSVVDSKEYIKRVIEETESFTVWNKLYRADLLKDIFFKKGRNNEDSYFLFEVAKKLERENLKVLNIPKYVYYYRSNRDGSICNSRKKPLEIDILANLVEFFEYFKSNNDTRALNVKRIYNRKLILFCKKLISDSFLRGQYFDNYYIELKKVTQREANAAFADNSKMRVHFFLIKHFPKVYKKAFKGKSSPK